MSKLTYLFAPILYSNTTASYTLGVAETDTQNTETDALSYIYKDAEGKNTSLYFVDIRYATKLKWTSYLSTCTGIEYLYMDGNTSIKDASTLATVIGNCGANYTIPSTFTTSIISNTSTKLDLSNITLSKDDFENLKNNTNLIYLNLENISIQDAGTNLTGTSLNDEINSVLATCPNIQYLRLKGISNLTTIEFVNNVTGLLELDLRGTNVTTGSINADNQYTGLELLNEKATKLTTLAIDNETIELKEIQTTMRNVSVNVENRHWFSHAGGLILGNATLYNKLNECTTIDILKIDLENAGVTPPSETYDLTGMISLKRFTGISLYSCLLKFPSSLENLYLYIVNKVDLSDVTNLKAFSYGAWMNHLTYDNVSFTFGTMSGCNQIESIDVYARYSTYKDLKFLESLYGKKLKTFKLRNAWTSYVDSAPLTISSLEGIENLSADSIHLVATTLSDISRLSSLKEVKDLNLGYNKLKDITPLSTLTDLTTLTLNNNAIVNIEALRNLTNLTYLNLNNNSITDIKPLENLKKLETLYLQSNALYDSSFDSTGKAYYTLTVVSDLNQNQDGNLKNLYLSGNSIEDFSMLQDSNLKWDLKSGW